MNLNYKSMKLLGVTLLFALMAVACKEKEILGEDPYGGGKDNLGIAFIGDYPSPENGQPGTEVTFNIRGLKKFENQYEFFINEQRSEVVSLTDSTITIIVPELVSSGGASVRVDGQVFFGPRLEVEGKVNVDINYKIVNGTNSQISDAIEADGSMIIVGGFTNFENLASNALPINNIVALTNTGARSSAHVFGRGGNGNISSIIKLSNNQYVIGGGFSSFNNHPGILNVTALHNNGQLDTTVVEVINLNPEDDKDGLDTVPTFNGGVYGGVRKLLHQNHPDLGERIIAVGSFMQYGTYFYPRSTRDNHIVDITQVRNIMRFDSNGKIDSTFAINTAANSFLAGANGDIVTAHYRTTDDKIVLAGRFTTFQGKPANRLVRLSVDGYFDDTFNIGSGANGPISSLEYDPITDTYMVVGEFTQYNGVSVDGIVRIHEDGSVDPTFQFRSVEGGRPNYAKQLSTGKVIVSGTFERYDNVIRRGLLILESDGEAKQEYNSFGSFEGVINKIIESNSSNGQPGVILMGYIIKFNDLRVNNILKIEIEN